MRSNLVKVYTGYFLLRYDKTEHACRNTPGRRVPLLQTTPIGGDPTLQLLLLINYPKIPILFCKYLVLIISSSKVGEPFKIGLWQQRIYNLFAAHLTTASIVF